MRGKLLFAAGAALGYVLGSKQGRQAYETIKTKASDTWANPKVRESVDKVTDLAREKLPGGEQVAKAAHRATDKVDDAAESSNDSPEGGDGSTTQDDTPTPATVANSSSSDGNAVSSNNG